MAATNRLLGAALALPGVMVAAPSHAEAPPADGLIGLRYMYYEDYQHSFDRIKVNSPSLYLLAPIGQWSLESTLVHDSISGASPRYHTAVSGASKMDDKRNAGDASVSRYFSRGSITLGGAYSNEHDYTSRSGNVRGRLSTEDNNTTLNLGYAHTADTINDVDGLIQSMNDGKAEKRKTNEYLVGVTQVLSRNDIVQITGTYSDGKGYYSDPYKSPDNRPRDRQGKAGSVRWNHHFDAFDATLRMNYRYYTDNWDLSSNTLGLEWVQELPWGITVVPSVRYYSQSSADFYYDPVYDSVLGAPFPPAFNTPAGPRYYSPDQRLSAFGAVTGGIKIIKDFGPVSIDIKGEYYEQRGSWRLGKNGSPDLDPFRAQSYQAGVTTKF
ncbi:DUF3570 domain-containing protein [soil metagenome]